ncbi:MAG: urea ABC transporter permease subunit UrtB, partial [Xanthobacteraceae bacterium]
MRFSRACLVALLLALGLALGCATVRAAGLDEALAHFTTDDFSDTTEGISAVAASGNPRAETIIRALQDGQLMFSAERKAVYIKDDSGKLTDAATGQAIAGEPPDDLDNVRINNRLRGALDAALGGLTLLASDPGSRYEAAQAVFKSREASALPTLDTAIAKEQDPRVKRALLEARAAVILFIADAKDEDKLAAVDIVRQRGDQEALGLLSSLPAGTPAPVMKAAAAAIAAINNRLVLWNAVQNAWYGVSLGSVLLLAAIGLAITFGVMGVINMAHGEMVMVGAYVTFVVQETIRTRNPALFDY